MQIKGQAWLTRLSALRERYRLNPPDQTGNVAPTPQIVRIVCSDGLGEMGYSVNNTDVQQEKMKVRPRRSDRTSILDALAAMSDADIDTSDIPETTEFPNPRRGVYAASPNRKLCPDNDSSDITLERKS